MKFKVDEISSVIRQEIENYRTEIDVTEVGRVLELGDGVARLYGLGNAMASEMLEFENGAIGQVFNLEENSVGTVILGDYLGVKEGDTVKRTGAIVEVPVGKGLLGRVVDGLGNPIDGKGPIESGEMRRVDVKAPGILPRKSVHEPMQTGLKAIDALIPDGRGRQGDGHSIDVIRILDLEQAGNQVLVRDGVSESQSG